MVERKRIDKQNLLVPLMPTQERMRPFWVAGLSAAAGNQEMLAAFCNETGFCWRPATCAIDRLIDDATGVEFFKRFAQWYNQNVWGEVDGRACNGDEPITEVGE